MKTPIYFIIGAIDEVRNKNMKKLEFHSSQNSKLTHYLFRYPARFHPPMVRKLIQNYTSPGNFVLDPFCGSGTLLIECSTTSRNSAGFDVDPLAIFISNVRTHGYSIKQLNRTVELITKELMALKRSDKEYNKLSTSDIGERKYRQEISSYNLWVPSIPNINHWFKRYIISDLAKVISVIDSIAVPTSHKRWLLLCFISIIRNASNADPVPVSGLEVTSYMRRLITQGRYIDPIELFVKRMKLAIIAFEEFNQNRTKRIYARAFKCDTRFCKPTNNTYDVVITSPPYLSAVDYYRRHTLEMYWARLVADQSDRLSLLPNYFGRQDVSRESFAALHHIPLRQLATQWEEQIRRTNERKSRAFSHYIRSMTASVHNIRRVLKTGSNCVLYQPALLITDAPIFAARWT